MATLLLAAKTDTFATLTQTCDEGALVIVLGASKDRGFWTRYAPVTTRVLSDKQVHEIAAEVVSKAVIGQVVR